MTHRTVTILGSTGSIGRQGLEVIAETPGIEVAGLAAGANWQLLAQQASRFRPAAVAIADRTAEGPLTTALADAAPGTAVLAGPQAMVELVRLTRAGVLLSGVVGSQGLAATLAAIECGSRLAIANKETLVMAGAIVMPAAQAAGVEVLPVDSEHSAVFQCLQAGGASQVRRVTITASGGALRDWEEHRVAAATVDEALNHPTWQMGRKITIDSATLVNKALEVIEAHWLFGLSAEQIDVVQHPESIVHSYVEFCDGSVIAQLARPDMKMPIAYALSYPQRPVRDTPSLDLAAMGKLTFRPLNARFRRAVRLGYEAISRGGVAGAVLNGANEAAVEAFLAGRISFGRIVPLVEEILNLAPAGGEVTLSSLQRADAWARDELAGRLGRR
jgi:1-deoxy-D-xylulose-5-phosphate reductoisomerase